METEDDSIPVILKRLQSIEEELELLNFKIEAREAYLNKVLEGLLVIVKRNLSPSAENIEELFTQSSNQKK